MATSQKSKKDAESKTVEYARGLVEFSNWGIKNSLVLKNRDRAQRYYAGDHAVRHRSELLGNYVFNKFAQIARNRTAHIVSKRPRWRFMPTQEQSIFTAQALQDIMGTVIWDKIKWSKKGEASVNEARDAGSSHIKIYIRKDGFPDAEPLCADELILDPKAKKKSKLRYWGHVYPMGIKDIERIYGKKVEPDMELEMMKYRSVKATKSFDSNISNTAPVSVFKSVRFKEGNTWMPDFIGRATVYELWIDDKTTETIPYKPEEALAEHENLVKGMFIDVHPFESHSKHIKDHEAFLAQLDGEKDVDVILALTEHIQEHATYPQSVTRKKYPFGRKIVYSGSHLLYDNPNPIASEMEVGIDFRDLLVKWDYDHGPEYWGKPGILDLFDPQDILNHRVNAITTGINRLNHGIKKITKGIGKTMRGALEGLANWVGMTIPVSHPDDVVVDYGPQMPSQIWQERIDTERFMESVMDHTDILSGQLPKGSPAGVTVNQLLSEGMKPINLIVKHYAEALQEMARTMMILMIEFVPDDTKIRITDDKENLKYVDWDQVKQAMGHYDIHIDVDAMLETSRQERLETALKLYEAQVYDREQVLTSLDDPDKYEVIERNGERQILTSNLQSLEKQQTELQGHFQNLKQNYIRLSLELDIERAKNNGKDERSSKDE